jgi:undecaprenyl-diphosphatase
VSALDHLLRAWIVEHRSPLLDPLMWTLGVVGRGGLVWIAITALLAILRRLPLLALLQLGLALLLAAIVVDNVLKPAVHRERPYVAVPQIAVIGGKPDDYSFPSGHAGTSFAGATTLAGLFPAWRVAWWTLALLIAYSRVYLGVHYPLDVIAGAAIGTACGAVVAPLFGRVPKNQGNRRSK